MFFEFFILAASLEYKIYFSYELKILRNQRNNQFNLYINDKRERAVKRIN